MKSAESQGFSLTELLVTIAIILILASITVVGLGEGHISARRLECQHRLEQLGHACQMWSNARHGDELAAIGGSPTQSKLWYHELAAYLSPGGTAEKCADALNCPLAPAAVDDDETDVTWSGGADILFSYDRYRSWMDFLDLVNDLRAAGWPGSIHVMERYEVNNPGVFNPITSHIHNYGIFSHIDAWWKSFTAPELAAVKAFQQEARGIFVSADHHASFTVANNQIAEYCGWGLWNPASVDRSGKYAPVSTHPIGAGVTKFVGYNSEGRIELQSDPAKQNPYARLVMTSPLHSGSPPDAICGTMDDGKARVVMETAWTKFSSPGWYYQDAECKPSQFRYVWNIYKWLLERSSSGTRITYGYNNQVGSWAGGSATPQAGPAEPSRMVRILDYEDFIADHDGAGSDDPPHYAALRHGGRANVLFVDGHVEALTLAELQADNWARWSTGR
jgi:prepilin-type processing-associated H-X9-DG protein/prepilin-type N-terminal cleavage/methylation domain-containing protein